MAFASFPLPVLGNGQGDERDVASEWKVDNFVYETGTEDIDIKVRVLCDDPDLARLINEGSAKIVAQWKCSSTISSGYLELTKSIIHSDGITYSASLDQRTVLGPVVVSVFAVATCPIPDFRWARQHADYGDDTFDIRTGDLLTVPSKFKFDPAKLYDPQNPPLNSIFRIVTTKDRPRKQGIDISYAEDDQIIVTISPDLFDQVQMMDSANLQITMLVLPALVDAIDFIRDNESRGEDGEDLETRQWYRTLKQLMEAKGIKDDARPLSIAQRLLSYPIDGYANERKQQDEEEAQHD